MSDFLVSALLAPSRATLRLIRFFMWLLVYAGACLAALVYLLKALGHVLRHPRRGCCGQPRRKAPSCLQDPCFGQHHFLHLKTSGLRLHYVSRGEGPLMLLLHGFPQIWISWRYQLMEFYHDFHVVALDLRGYGSSDSPTNLNSYTIDALTTDIKDAIEALEYALHHPSQLLRSGYVFLFQLPWLPEKLLSISDFQILKDTMTHPMTGIHGLTDDELEAFLYSFTQNQGLTGPLNYYRNIFSHFPLQRQELTTPTLLLWGEKDPYLESGLVDSINKYFVPGRLLSYVLPDAGHWIPQAQPEQMHHYMWAFLKRFKV
ncbi:epoxide hydrolase 3 isoform X2 [Phascolarctos cinereus]